MDEAIAADVRRIVSAITQVPPDRLAPDLDLIDAGLVDSLRALQIVNDLERFFDVLISDEEVGTYTTIRTITQGIARLRNGHARAS